ncbi:hypothetical protein FRC06_011834 [Ceratobasidium sp. 370]|nr:hypothetical protein FRC06_011834 [Ceratobasidium sp. 370]
MAHHLKCGGITPFSALQSLKHVIQHFAKTTMGLPCVPWTNEMGDRVQLDSHVVKMDDMHKMIVGHLKETQEFLNQKVLMGLTLDEIGYGIAPDTPIIDDLLRTSPGYSFLTDPLNPFHKMTTLLAKAFLQHPKVKGHFCSGLDEHGAPVWIRSQVADWLRDLEELTEKLSLLMFLLGGQPPRGTEFCMLKLHNPTTWLRGMFWLDGLLLYVIAYSKALVRPLAVDWTYALYGEDRARTQDITLTVGAGVPIGSDQLSPLLEQLTLQFTGLAMGFQHWRHLMITIMRRHLLTLEWMRKERLPTEWMVAKVRGVAPVHPEHEGVGGEGGEGTGAGPLADKGKGKAMEQSQRHPEEDGGDGPGHWHTEAQLEGSHPRELQPAAPVDLRALLGDPEAWFKGDHQGMALATVATQRTHLLAVLPTGQGKSVLLMPPAKMKPMVTVVIIPLVALKMDLVDRGLVLLSAETAGFETFRDWLLLQLNKGKLAWVCIDKAHLLLTSVHYQPMLGVLSGLGSVGVPLLLTMATLPPTLSPT